MAHTPGSSHRHQVGFLRATLDALPSAVLMVNQEAEVVDCNQAATALFGEGARGRRLGQAVHCFALTPDQPVCGATPFCPDCLVRQALTLVRDDPPGSPPRSARLTLRAQPEARPVSVSVEIASLHDAPPGHSVVIINRSPGDPADPMLIPVCAACKRIRAFDHSWHSLESMLEERFHLLPTQPCAPTASRSSIPS